MPLPQRPVQSQENYKWHITSQTANNNEKLIIYVLSLKQHTGDSEWTGGNQHHDTLIY